MVGNFLNDLKRLQGGWVVHSCLRSPVQTAPLLHFHIPPVHESCVLSDIYIPLFFINFLNKQSPPPPTNLNRTKQVQKMPESRFPYSKQEARKLLFCPDDAIVVLQPWFEFLQLILNTSCQHTLSGVQQLLYSVIGQKSKVS